MTFTQTAAPSDIYPQRSVGYPQQDFLAYSATSQVTIGGIGTFNLTNPTGTYNFANPGSSGGDFIADVQTTGNSAGQIDLGVDGLNAVTGPSFDLSQAWASLTAATIAAVGTPIATDGGILTLTSVNPTTTFTAEPASVPEPSSLVVFGAGTALAVMIRQTRRRTARRFGASELDQPRSVGGPS